MLSFVYELPFCPVGLHPPPQSPPAPDLAHPNETRRLSREKQALEKQIMALKEDLAKIKARNTEEGLRQLPVPIEKMTLSLQKEEDLWEAFGDNPEADDLLAMSERLSQMQTRLGELLTQYAKIDKLLHELETRLTSLQGLMDEIKAKNPGAALTELYVPIEKIDKRLFQEKELLRAMGQAPNEEDLSAVLERLDALERQLNQVRQSYRYAKGLDIQFEASALFLSGQFALSSKGLRQMDLVAKDIRNSLDRYKKRFPNEPIRMLVKVTGYADEQPFYPTQPIEERRRQNQRISQQRAESVGNFLKQSLEDQVDALEPEFIGQGEALPPGVVAGPPQDARRRICTLSILIYSN
ncbi:MAG: hypothetical protein HC913_15685 [Microscillaceae bacterium]|nr:hypothetical protein [Microscillaceae bacterium]